MKKKVCKNEIAASLLRSSQQALAMTFPLMARKDSNIEQIVTLCS